MLKRNDSILLWTLTVVDKFKAQWQHVSLGIVKKPAIFKTCLILLDERKGLKPWSDNHYGHRVVRLRPLFSQNCARPLGYCIYRKMTDRWQDLFWPILQSSKNFKSGFKIFQRMQWFLAEGAIYYQSRGNLAVSPGILLPSKGYCTGPLRYLRGFRHIPTP